MQALNLRELIRKYGRNIGLNLKVVRVYTFQLLRVRRSQHFQANLDTACSAAPQPLNLHSTQTRTRRVRQHIQPFSSCSAQKSTWHLLHMLLWQALSWDWAYQGCLSL